jgi:hypothetical protein
MPVYLIRCGDTDMIKIGWADDPVERLATLQSAHHEPLAIVRLIDGPRFLEAWMHNHFAANRVRGEWFRLVPDMLTVAIGDVRPAAKECPDADVFPSVDVELLTAIERFLVRHGMTATMFGRLSARDPLLVHEIRKGRECKRAVRSRIMAFIASHSEAA